MTEVTYANLRFENNHELDNIAGPKDTKKKGSPTSFHSCWPAVLILLILCLTLLTALVTLAVLCQNCVLCPTNWNWKGGDTCYYHSVEKKSWEQSLQLCSSQNSTLLLIKQKEKLELVKKIPEAEYWLGFRIEQSIWYWADNTTVTEQQKSWVKPKYYPQGCGSVYYATMYFKSCKEELHYICEKPAIQLQRCNSSCQEGWFVRANDYERLDDVLQDV
ncbi:killer cell lectin-like receptor subfamily G member 1 isoform X2 [Melopsittacus undulatus]|uniref:killer cell lectin-like receptor subfamily G member 1 isoform X2 n=1 Tax=Melopsittacus undulatus TaxID=13146 RepID=UPI0012436ADC|nr:killer cell lectin-like receptor subfamily G member 1 isoform X2 [Melopsittacus undulatus]